MDQQGHEQPAAAPLGPGFPAMDPALSLNERLELALEAAEDAVVWTDAHGVVQWCNARFAAVSRLPRAAAQGRRLIELLPLDAPGGAAPAEHPVATVLKGRAQLSAACVLKNDGRSTYWQIAGSWIMPPKEEAMAVFWLHEVTGRVLAERAANRLWAIHSATQEAVISLDLDGVITDWNAAAERIYGYSRQDALGKRFGMLLPSDVLALHEEKLARVRSGAGPVEFETRRRRKDGRSILVRATLLGWPDEDGRLCGFVSVARDITEQRRAEAALAHQMDELVRSNRQLEDFASTVSHDLLAPLSKISVFADLLEQRSAGKGLDAQSQDFLARMIHAAARMRALICDLLQYSRVFGDATPLETVELQAVVRGVLADLETQLSQAKAVVEVGSLPAIRARPFQMRQLFQNLIANAVKFSKKGEPARVSIDSGFEHPGFVEIRVRDQGIGFEQSEAEKIFEPFVRLHARAQYEGSGIGLAVCRRIVLRHGGWISADSAPGRGTTFTISLPTQS